MHGGGGCVLPRKSVLVAKKFLDMTYANFNDCPSVYVFQWYEHKLGSEDLGLGGITQEQRVMMEFLEFWRDEVAVWTDEFGEMIRKLEPRMSEVREREIEWFWRDLERWVQRPERWGKNR